MGEQNIEVFTEGSRINNILIAAQGNLFENEVRLAVANLNGKVAQAESRSLLPRIIK